MLRQATALSRTHLEFDTQSSTNKHRHKDRVCHRISSFDPSHIVALHTHPTSSSALMPRRPFNMAEPNKITGITNTLAKATLGDGAVSISTTMPNNIRPKAAITSLTTMFEVVWYKPHRYIWLQYITKEKAGAVCEALQGKEVAGIHFRCDFKEAPRSQTLRFSVRLQGMPPNVELSDISPHLPQGEEPDGIAFSNLSYQDNWNVLEHICNKIRARTSEQIKYRKSIEIKDGRKQKAEITLQAEAANLAAHAKDLDGITLPELGNGKVFFVERLRLYVAIESKFYKRRSKALKGIADRAWNTHHIEMKIFDGELRYAQNTSLILIMGNGRDAVKKVKAEIDGCIAADAIKGLQREAGLPVTKRVIYLNTVKEFRQAVDGGGLDPLRKSYGDDAVSFDEKADPPSITVTPLDGKVDKAKEILFRKYAEGTDVGECSICAEENVKLLKAPDCEHFSCETCLDDYCTTNASAALPLRCFSNLECNTIFPIHWLEYNLSPVAYRANVSEHSPECGQLVQPASDMRHAVWLCYRGHLKGKETLVCDENARTYDF
jgi:hypothetical protein